MDVADKATLPRYRMTTTAELYTPNMEQTLSMDGKIMTPLMKHENIYSQPGISHHGGSMLDEISSMPIPAVAPDHACSMLTSHAQMYASYSQHSSVMCSPSSAIHQHELDCDPRELEAFAERFKQRRIKLGVTQADVGKALGNLKLPGVGSLSQSTICRFESLTLSHNNMIALKPVLAAWLDEAERQAHAHHAEVFNTVTDKKRKRTSIAAPEKRSLEAYFAVQPRPSGEKIAQIADKLDLKKNVVRVWFCNQRQKQKRMKFSANMMPHHH